MLEPSDREEVEVAITARDVKSAACLWFYAGWDKECESLEHALHTLARNTAAFSVPVTICKVDLEDAELEEFAMDLGVSEPGMVVIYVDGEKQATLTSCKDPDDLIDVVEDCLHQPAGNKDSIRAAYEQTVDGQSILGGGGGCCGVGRDYDAISRQVGYTDEEIRLGAVGGGSNLGLGCGNPLRFAGLQPGEAVLDLGSGAGFDCFLAAEELKGTGHVIGVDMTPKMISRARENIKHSKFAKSGRLEFRLGEIEYLPVADSSVDVVISNCVINLSDDKLQVFREMHRALKPGGRVAFTDVVATSEIPQRLRTAKALAC